MNLRKCTLISVCLFLIMLSNAILQVEAEVDDSLDVMLIHSYDLSYQWTKNQDSGFTEALLSEYPKANIYTEVLDANRFDEAYIFNNQMTSFKTKYKDKEFDIIVATDDVGLVFALKARDDLNIRVPIVFSGVLESKIDELVGNHKDVTGVFEIREFKRMISLMRLLQPDANRIVIINDTSSSSKQLVSKVLSGFEELDLNDDYEIENWEEKPYKNILEDIKQLDTNTAVFLISYNKSFDGIVKTGQTFSNEISEFSPVPMYSLGEIYFGAGITGGEFLSGYLQGEELARIAIEILNGKDVKEIPYSKKSTSYLGVDENMTRKYGLEGIELPEDTMVINEELSFYEQYQTLVLVVVISFTILLAFIITLLIQRSIINRANSVLESQKRKLQFEADHDNLTGLHNRESHEKAIDQFLSADANHQKKYIVAFIDLDNFKFINNSMGHQAGDVILKEVARRLNTLGEDYSVARIGGDEFIVVYEFSVKNSTQVFESIKQVIHKIFVLPILVGTKLISVSASMGCSFYPEDAITYDELVIYADLAMYEAKRKRKGNMLRFSESIEKGMERVYKLVNEIENGIDKNEFYLVYQPIFTADGLHVKDLEVLLRWESKEFGNVSPTEFIHAAEVGGHMIMLGDRVFEMAFSFLERRIKYLGDDKKISINISVTQLYEEDFVEKLLNKLNKYQVNPNRIQLEIIESVMMHSYEIIYDKLSVLKQNGISIALDDFGTGYSSLAHLSRLPIDILKIDKHFVDSIGVDEQAYHVIEAISLLAKSINLFSVAEGVETELQAEYLRKININYIQGYLYSKPLKEDDILKLLEENNLSSH